MIGETVEETAGEQANVFSAVVGIFGTKALDSFSNWEKHRHAYIAASVRCRYSACYTR